MANLNRLINKSEAGGPASCANKTFLFTPGIYVLSGDRLTFDRPDAHFVMGVPKGWTSPAGVRASAVFTDPQTFDIRRSPNPHLSFGIGEHFCLGVHLARLEIRVFLEELLASFATIEPTGAPVKIRSNLNNGYKRMPMRLARS